MSRFLFRTIAVALVPCLVFKPIYAFVVPGVGAGSPAKCRFTSQALAEPPASDTHRPAHKNLSKLARPFVARPAQFREPGDALAAIGYLESGGASSGSHNLLGMGSGSIDRFDQAVSEAEREHEAFYQTPKDEARDWDPIIEAMEWIMEVYYTGELTLQVIYVLWWAGLLASWNRVYLRHARPGADGKPRGFIRLNGKKVRYDPERHDPLLHEFHEFVAFWMQRAYFEAHSPEVGRERSVIMAADAAEINGIEAHSFWNKMHYFTGLLGMSDDKEITPSAGPNAGDVNLLDNGKNHDVYEYFRSGSESRYDFLQEQVALLEKLKHEVEAFFEMMYLVGNPESKSYSLKPSLLSMLFTFLLLSPDKTQHFLQPLSEYTLKQLIEMIQGEFVIGRYPRAALVALKKEVQGWLDFNAHPRGIESARQAA